MIVRLSHLVPSLREPVPVTENLLSRPLIKRDDGEPDMAPSRASCGPFQEIGTNAKPGHSNEPTNPSYHPGAMMRERPQREPAPLLPPPAQALARAVLQALIFLMCVGAIPTVFLSIGIVGRCRLPLPMFAIPAHTAL